ncbi:hypothetical protein [Streptomyces sp. MMS24-I29]|uniref:hypothetical protein n=1 Tax=Streptomyces sp. MMS24-I29 TaxID=3351480 RepID=UPI003C7B5A81
MPGTKPDLKSLRATKYTSSTRTTGSLERLRRLGYNAGLQALDLWDTLRGRGPPAAAAPTPPPLHRQW